ncbi:MAG: YihY family inner membrane protein, partial [Deltaproteobacteria bacterium]
ASMFLTSAIAFIQGYPYPFRLPIDIGPILQWVLKYALPLVFTFWIFFLIYKIVPNRKIHFKTALKAAFFAGFLWETAKQLFGWYVLHLSRFSVVYGSLSALAIFFIWIYYSAAILLLGGEVASLMEEGRKRI